MFFNIIILSFSFLTYYFFVNLDIANYFKIIFSNENYYNLNLEDLLVIYGLIILTLIIINILNVNKYLEFIIKLIVIKLKAIFIVAFITISKNSFQFQDIVLQNKYITILRVYKKEDYLQYFSNIEIERILKSYNTSIDKIYESIQPKTMVEWKEKFPLEIEKIINMTDNNVFYYKILFSGIVLVSVIGLTYIIYKKLSNTIIESNTTNEKLVEKIEKFSQLELKNTFQIAQIIQDIFNLKNSDLKLLEEQIKLTNENYLYLIKYDLSTLKNVNLLVICLANYHYYKNNSVEYITQALKNHIEKTQLNVDLKTFSDSEQGKAIIEKCKRFIEDKLKSYNKLIMDGLVEIAKKFDK